MKICTKCKENKHLNQYSKQKSNKSGLRSWCRACVSFNETIYRKNHVDKLKYDKKIYSKNNEEKLRVNKKVWYNSNKDCVNLKCRKYYKINKDQIKTNNKTYAIKNRGRINAINAKYKAAKLAAIPKNLTEKHHEQIKAIYKLSSTFTRILGVRYHVDHVIPLQGRNGEKGDHAPWNLRIIRADGDDGNHAKNNIISKEFLEEQLIIQQQLKKEVYGIEE